MKRANPISRRRALKLGGAAAAAASLPLVHVRTASAAGSLTMGIWDHWVPAANPVLKSIVGEWAEKNKVDVTVDFIASAGNKMILTQAAEAQAGAGHDLLAFDQWNAHRHGDKLTPVNDVVDGLIKKYGPVSKAVEYLGKSEGKWLGVPMAWGSAPLPTVARISLIKKFTGEDVTEWYPASNTKTKGAADWTYDKFLTMAEKCHKAGFTFGLGCGSNSTDANQTWGATFGAFGAHLVDAKGNITVDSDPVREVLDYVKRMVPFLPSTTISFDDASNNKIFVGDKSALIWNPPSAWAVAKRDAPEIAKDVWHFPNPKGKMGRLVPHRPYFWGIWQWSKNKQAAKDLMVHLSQREIVAKLSVPAAGYDIPPFLSMADLPVWADTEPPKGTIYNYPLRPHHEGEYYIVGSSGTPEMGEQIWNQYVIPQMVARMVSGNSAKETIDWAQKEIEGFRR
ncbi:MAG: ABC transporter substrate-binding protein [Hyphomicrobiaceae bacterium]